MKILAIDPGTTKSAAVIYDDGEVVSEWTEANKELLHDLHTGYKGIYECKKLNIKIKKVIVNKWYVYGIGKSVLDTVIWVGRFIEAWGGDWDVELKG